MRPVVLSGARHAAWLGLLSSLSGLSLLSSLALSTQPGCAPRRATPARGIELEPPSEIVQAAPDAGTAAAAEPAFIASGGEPAHEAEAAAAASEHDDSEFVYSREPLAERVRAVARFPIHIHEAWWPFRARQLGISEADARKRDARISGARAPAGFWDSQTAVEAVSLWTVLCNECHGGRRSIDDVLQMPEPARTWGEASGLFFGNRRTYRQLFNTVHDGGRLEVNGRAGMPAWRNILSNEMMWALLYFLEYQSGGIESRFPPSLYPRRPQLLGAP